jgi:YD repeat-containing protein
MIRNLLAGAAAFALMTGAALAQDGYSAATQSRMPPNEVSATTVLTSQGAGKLPPLPASDAANAAPGPVGPNFRRTTTTRHYDTDGSETWRTDTVERHHQVVYDANGQPTERTTVDTKHSLTFYPPQILPAAPPPVAYLGPTPVFAAPPPMTTYYPESSTQTTTTEVDNP